MRVEYGVADGRRGPQALSVRFLERPPSVAAARRKRPDEMVPLVEDLITLLAGISNGYRRGRHPDRGAAKKVATVLRAVAEDLEGPGVPAPRLVSGSFAMPCLPMKTQLP